MKLQSIGLFLLIGALCSCTSLYTGGYSKPALVDNKPAMPTKKLHKKLYTLTKEGFAIGHQDATSYGVGWRQSPKPKTVRSDVFDVVADYPAVYGFDIGGIEHNSDYNLDSVSFSMMRALIVDAYKNGGIITLSWHADNPTSDGDSWDKTPAVADILPGGIEAAKYSLWLDRVAGFIKSLKYRGKQVPVIFRPYHEMNGDWFWWGDPNSNKTDYIKLWQYTVEQLRDKHKLHNILYTYSPNKLNPEDDYMKYYPGDDYVDILGIDIYDFYDSASYVTSVVRDLAIVKYVAESKDKLFAFTETGIESIKSPHWFTQVLYPAIKDSGITWVLFWRNARETHHYMPYKGHLVEEDFKKFKSLPKTLFLKDINTIKY